jgi:hypothetical protein
MRHYSRRKAHAGAKIPELVSNIQPWRSRRRITAPAISAGIHVWIFIVTSSFTDQPGEFESFQPPFWIRSPDRPRSNFPMVASSRIIAILPRPRIVLAGDSPSPVAHGPRPDLDGIEYLQSRRYLRPSQHMEQSSFVTASQRELGLVVADRDVLSRREHGRREATGIAECRRRLLDQTKSFIPERVKLTLLNDLHLAWPRHGGSFLGSAFWIFSSIFPRFFFLSFSLFWAFL